MFSDVPGDGPVCRCAGSVGAPPLPVGPKRPARPYSTGRRVPVRLECQCAPSAFAPRTPRAPACPGAISAGAPVRRAPRAPTRVPARAVALPPRALLSPCAPRAVATAVPVCGCRRAPMLVLPRSPAPPLAYKCADAPHATAHPVRRCTRACGASMRVCSRALGTPVRFFAWCTGAHVRFVGGTGGGGLRLPLSPFSVYALSLPLCRGVAAVIVALP